MMREIKDTDLVGKTIQSIDSTCINVLKLAFTDGTNLELWAETAVSTNAGQIPGIYVDVPRPKSVPPPLPNAAIPLINKQG